MLVCFGVVGWDAEFIHSRKSARLHRRSSSVHRRLQPSTCCRGCLLGLLLTSCAIGPEYSREPAPVPVEYKEIKGWKVANPNDDAPRGDWWKVYNDHGLDTLLPQVEISNQTVAAAAASL